MELLTEEVGFETQENLCTLDLSKIESLSGHFFRICHHGIDVWPHEVSKRLRSRKDFLQYLFFLGLKG